ncbi:hypothetical protein DL96DRAFT_1064930 [Flagelloscypha sp. PMI_526]|nr:hypothetical protein DL96DRAFT_1064930 [Flagelloscypha sp. PMI_526]
MADAIPPAVLITAAFHLTAAKYFQLASFIMLVYDHCITFGDEVERIWKRKMTGASILFLINRYGTAIQFAFIVNAFNDPSWSTDFCDRVVAFEGYTTVALVGICELIMILRIFALFSRNYFILGFLLVVLAGQIILSCYGLSTGFRAALPPGFVGCIFTGPADGLFPAVWYTPSVTDFIIFVLTIVRARVYWNSQSAAMPTIIRFVQDGILYFLVIFAANLANVIIFRLAVDDLKAMGASFSQCISSVMISRLVLNLRAVGETNASDTFLGRRMQQYRSQSSSGGGSVPSGGIAKASGNDFLTRTIGDLGQELRSWGDDASYWVDDRPAKQPPAAHFNAFELAQMANNGSSKSQRYGGIATAV